MRRSRSVRAFALLLLSGWLPGCAVMASESMEPDPSLATVEVAGVALDPRTQSPVVLLRDPASDQVVPIWIGVPEAEAIARSLEGVQTPRPMTHDLFANTVQRLGARIEEVVISQQREGTYYGVIRLTTGNGANRIDVDSRPSDGLALALRTGATIRVARELFVDTPPESRPPPPTPI
jgi:uncharacterized protein